jgi:adenylate kinase
MEDFIIEPYNEKLPSLLIFGPPGIGKGTLCKFLSTSPTVYHLSTGDIFRSLSKRSPAGRLAASYSNQGLFLPDEISIQIWYNYVQGLISTNKYFPNEQHLLLDGIPRTLTQAEMIEKYVNIKGVIVLEVKDSKVLVNRLKGRAAMEKRQDDANDEILQKRLEVYQNETAQVLQHYPKDIIYKVNAEQKPLEVLRDTLILISHLIAYAP